MAALTQASAKNIPPQPKRVFHHDGGCQALFLVVQPSGHKSWCFKYRRPRSKRAAEKIFLGPFDQSSRPPVDEPKVGQPLTLAEARLIATRLTNARKAGRDVALEARSKKLDEAGSNSFLACCRDHIIRHVNEKRNRREVIRMLGFDLELNPVPGGLARRWAERPVTNITDDELWQVIDQARGGVGGTAIKKKGALESRRRKMYSALSVLFAWLKKERRVKVNPMLNLDSPGAPEERDRVLTKTELKQFWAACEAVTPPFGDVFRLLLLTAARLNELARLQWSEISDDGSSIFLDKSRTKNKKPFILPLAPLARAIIEGQPRLGPYVFSTTEGRRPISGFSKVKRRLDHAMGDPQPWRLHDLRRTTATMLAEELDVRSEVIEAILNHISGKKDGIAGNYNRAEYREQKRGALEGWALYLLNLLGSGAWAGPVQDREEKVA
jgi:integrase